MLGIVILYSRNIVTCKRILNSLHTLSLDFVIIIIFFSTIRFNFVGADIRGTRLEADCPALPECPVEDKYRTFDGSCNNLKNTEWGRANTDVQR